MDTTIRTFALCAMSMCLSMVGGCAPDTGADDGDDWTLGSDAGADVTPPPGGDAGSNDPYATSFRLENTGDRPMRVQMVGNCDRNPPGWLSPDVGNGGPVGGGCGTCDCETIEQQGDCAVCAASRACEPPHVREIEAGGVVDWRWSGRRFVSDTVDGQTCERSEVPQYGESMTATFCWSEQDGETGPETVLRDEETTCETVDFEYGEQTTITHTVSPENQSQPTEFILENRAGFSVDVTDPSICTQVDNPWLSVYPAGDVEMDLATDCTVCSCEEAENEFCGVCERACPRPSPTELESGGEQGYVWNGVGHARREVEGQTCHEQMDFRPGQTLTAEFCWTEPYARNGDGAETTYCETTTFEYGQETVRHTIEPQR